MLQTMFQQHLCLLIPQLHVLTPQQHHKDPTLPAPPITRRQTGPSSRRHPRLDPTPPILLQQLMRILPPKLPSSLRTDTVVLLGRDYLGELLVAHGVGAQLDQV